ncbi:uncharacterized protein BP5553_02894 [Venustampulla echinocandica]|uniref:Chromo domain-containing protein n=1 Tax=Venustampulla echinocandica TaxID=2656787 RepID=A0A370TST3_9HELO|nr:uncharacterized protein BP5553_02894 [Venustampulla echinocandica]RDL38554.1 hypothetical protein BP5553_02894 [Venustampulla echinocandica]
MRVAKPKLSHAEGGDRLSHAIIGRMFIERGGGELEDDVPPVLKMALNNAQQSLNYLEDDIYEDDGDEESLASLETDDGQDHPPERILAQVKGRSNSGYYLVKWQDCPIIRSSWEVEDLFSNYPWVLDAWQIEKQRQAEGLAKPLDLVAFHKAVSGEEVAHTRRRALRRLRRKFKRVLSIVST